MDSRRNESKPRDKKTLESLYGEIDGYSLATIYETFATQLTSAELKILVTGKLKKSIGEKVNEALMDSGGGTMERPLTTEEEEVLTDLDSLLEQVYGKRGEELELAEKNIAEFLVVNKDTLNGIILGTDLTVMIVIENLLSESGGACNDVFASNLRPRIVAWKTGGPAMALAQLLMEAGVKI